MLIVFLGDSITEGLGVIRSKTNYANLLQTHIKSLVSQPVEIVNFGASAMQVNESKKKYEQRILELQPDIIVFAHGITEAIVREQKRYLKWLPKRWRRPGWMDPRPYYSTRMLRRWPEKLESGLRWRVKVALIKVFGGKQWMSLEEFKQHTTDFVLNVLNNSVDTKIILLSPSDIEEKYFPGSPASMKQYRGVLNDICEKWKFTNRIFLCDTSQSLHKWNDYLEDRFHPNELGHSKIAKALMNTIIQYSLADRQMKKEVSQ
ncbi:GDSL-type esterase/lipase family protein [Paenibacillus sp. N3/727]|uniref:SGNH/GDSL hydrolase family protein n=1 Tax=Paenibacillus sp. N3/727 TaxID=2925845 RepID=UPI001F537B32|nr:GDSL-type esterase/lipase family protein [Paenibacillus sp. N3/727]UNK18764.1 GDSL-type esterase/lipase family protein [Paenibacillus sp. N3/727]